MTSATAAAPRLLLVDMTPLGGVSATGALKEVYFGEWPADRIIQLHEEARGTPSLIRPLSLAKGAVTGGKIRTECAAFDPEIILYRPVAERPRLHALAMEIIADHGAPHIIWLMDDWPERLRAADPAAHGGLDRDLRLLTRSAGVNYAISDSMARAFEERYGAPFKVARNGVRPEEWRRRERARGAGSGIVMRYAGSLAPDTTCESVLKAAGVVSGLGSAGLDISLEIRTQPHWCDQAGDRFRGLEHVSISPSSDAPAAYRNWLIDADIVLIAYNFDVATRRYLKYSFANKAPEALASGAAVLVFGPREIETVRFLEDSGAASCVVEDDAEALADAVRDLCENEEKRARLGEAGRRFAFDAFDLGRAKAGFAIDLAACLADPPRIWRSECTRIDECRFARAYLGQEPGVAAASRIMVDVGAHHGGALRPFAQDGWRVFAFEPDPENRRALIERYRPHQNVLIFPEAIGAQERAGVSFYGSAVSTGISSLHAFHPSHREAARVDVTTLNGALTREGLRGVDFLKIDVEGHEMAVLDGVDLDRFAPRVIVAEFDDAKTTSIGYDVHDLAARFIAAGYGVLLSEWRPVERYGGAHEWRRLRAYPCLTPAGAWGNLVAIRGELDDARIAAALESAADPPGAAPSKSVATRLKEHLMVHHPILAEALLFARWLPAALFGRLWAASVFLAVLTAAAVFGATEIGFGALWWALIWAGGAGTALFLLLIAYGLEKISRFKAEQIDELNALHNELKRLATAAGSCGSADDSADIPKGFKSPDN